VSEKKKALYSAEKQFYLPLEHLPGENMQCLAEDLKNIFAHIGGIPTRLWRNPPAVKPGW